MKETVPKNSTPNRNDLLTKLMILCIFQAVFTTYAAVHRLVGEKAIFGSSEGEPSALIVNHDGDYDKKYGPTSIT